MSIQESLTATIYRAIDDVNEQLPASSRLAKTPSTMLFGRNGGLDSLGLVNLIVALEKHIQRDMGRSVSLTDPEVIFAAENPFSSVQSLRQYVAAMLERE